MDCQLIFMVEAKKSSKTDWIYIKDTIDRFCKYDSHTKLSPVFMDGKGKYLKCEGEAKKLVKQYSANNKERQSKTIYCFDCDEYATSQTDKTFLEKVKNFCDERGYDFVWFCKDIEEVYIGNSVRDNEKKARASNFRKNKDIENVNENNLKSEAYRVGASNLLTILYKYLQKK